MEILFFFIELQKIYISILASKVAKHLLTEKVIWMITHLRYLGKYISPVIGNIIIMGEIWKFRTIVHRLSLTSAICQLWFIRVMRNLQILNFFHANNEIN